MTAYIVDDESRSVRVLTQLLKDYCGEVDIIGSANSAAEAFEFLKERTPDIVLLDIEMPVENGFDLLKNLMPVKFEVIFITAFDSYAIQAIKHNAIDYVLKPVSIDDLITAIERVGNKLALKHTSTQTINNAIEQFLENNFIKTKIGLPDSTGVVFIDAEEVMRIEADGSYCKIFFVNKSAPMLVSRHLGELEEMFPKDKFARVHSAHLINLQYIKRYMKGRGGYLEMADGSEVEVSVRRKDDFLSRFK